jgi:hypothetical protein
MRKIISVFLCLLVFGTALGTVSCSKNEITLAPIEEVTVSLLKSNPAQVHVHIIGGLPDGCTTFHEMKVTREDTTINIKVTNQRPKDKFCPAIYTTFEKDINLGTDFEITKTYTLKVNDYTTTFNY